MHSRIRGIRRIPRHASARCAGFWIPTSLRSSGSRQAAPTDDSVIDVRAIFQQGHRDLAVNGMPPVLLPRKGRFGLIDYEKMFCPDLKSGTDIFEMRGIDREQGCMVVVRPDQYVAHVLPLHGFDALADFFAGFMIEAD